MTRLSGMDSREYQLICTELDSLGSRITKLEKQVFPRNYLEDGAYYICIEDFDFPRFAIYKSCNKIFITDTADEYYIEEVIAYEKIPEPTIKK